jgi:hypothetical protein
MFLGRTSWLLCTQQGDGILFWHGSCHKMDSSTHSDLMTARRMADGRNLQFNVDSKPHKGFSWAVVKPQWSSVASLSLFESQSNILKLLLKKRYHRWHSPWSRWVWAPLLKYKIWSMHLKSLEKLCSIKSDRPLFNICHLFQAETSLKMWILWAVCQILHLKV